MTNDQMMQVLQKCPLFAGMSTLSIDLALGNISYQIINFAPRDVYTLAGMPCRFADIVLSGSLICRMVSLSGKQVEVTRLRPGNLIAPAFIFAKNNSMPVSVETDSEVTLLRMTPQTLKKLIDDDADIRMNYIRSLSNIDVFLTHKMKVLSLFTVREKVAYLLLERAGEQNSNTIRLTRSRQEIADSFGIQKFSLLRVLSEFEKEGVIRVDGKTIEIIDRSRLK
ncbi:Crp/Fnr family transcriptional regulator [Segatella salivae]|jgi:putative transcriptional regulator|uniref:Crp/Fnr family transcriptional regulator n=2 Tax=Segatella salivae TaxID=228604 RepID=A0AAW4NNK6_9BACT|nr:Crp/Fnr family transcriptional regulator [Segatella salivae]EFV03760.1 cyclic nucleotide-binding domain protein [Segatella salivae DSM 15606]MBF1520518.1 Crp/Fnr family transcriptional regulator [Segatella salivae]MBF1524558.1 Crp/Fnr family transcriptional regulator [Segatella salivae]MBF1528266.1 Crp/Fnr family transcriptional regulator [Segatella salivae]MBF1531201.1 Crp/Fnr family transcriptional regulator [Segatella salivae]